MQIKILKKRRSRFEACFADPKKANDILNWNIKSDLLQIWQSTWELGESYSK
tara:strand:- start:260 stop:415 length:156 start_codon:yes stop_codon:yes gene_type:complete